jgi:hypothetical protein
LVNATARGSSSSLPPDFFAEVLEHGAAFDSPFSVACVATARKRGFHQKRNRAAADPSGWGLGGYFLNSALWHPRLVGTATGRGQVVLGPKPPSGTVVDPASRGTTELHVAWNRSGNACIVSPGHDAPPQQCVVASPRLVGPPAGRGRSRHANDFLFDASPHSGGSIIRLIICGLRNGTRRPGP